MAQADVSSSSCVRVALVRSLSTSGLASTRNLAQVVSIQFDSEKTSLMKATIIIGLATIANMGAELGATTSTFPYTVAMRDYLIATGRAAVAQAADRAQRRGLLDRDEGAEWDDVVEIVRVSG